MDVVTHDLNRHLNAIDDREALEETIESELERIETHIQEQIEDNQQKRLLPWLVNPGQSTGRTRRYGYQRLAEHQPVHLRLRQGMHPERSHCQQHHAGYDGTPDLSGHQDEIAAWRKDPKTADAVIVDFRAWCELHRTLSSALEIIMGTHNTGAISPLPSRLKEASGQRPVSEKAGWGSWLALMNFQLAQA